MHRTARLVTLALFVVASLCMTPTTQALPRDWWITTYYDCSFNVVGYDLFDCTAHHYYVGAQTGAYKHYYQEECSTSNPVEDSWWYNDGGTWVTYNNQTCP
ncbi:MAG TPA: hypothetical protein VK504_11780 [Vicinamibacterales bacterium]|nr:hypothetical protein [Vicinamibacterales bacterium]